MRRFLPWWPISLLALQSPRQCTEYTFSFGLGWNDLLLDFCLFFDGLFGATWLGWSSLDLQHERARMTRSSALDTPGAWWLTSYWCADDTGVLLEGAPITLLEGVSKRYWGFEQVRTAVVLITTSSLGSESTSPTTCPGPVINPWPVLPQSANTRVERSLILSKDLVIEGVVSK